MFDTKIFREMSDNGILFGFNDETDTRRDLRYLTVDIPNYYDDPSLHICKHLEHIKKGYSKLFTGTKIGSVFENFFLDALLNFTGCPGKSLDIVSIHINNAVHNTLPNLIEYGADIDILMELINFKVAFLLKTSLRERWKQWDRDGFIIEKYYGNDIKKVFIFFREQADSTIESSLALAKKRESQLYVDGRVITTYDKGSMNKLFTKLYNGENDF